MWHTWHGPVLSEFVYDAVALGPDPVQPSAFVSPVVFTKPTFLAVCNTPPTDGGVMLSLTSMMFRVPCGVWQSRHVVDQAPYLVPSASEPCVGRAWQSAQSWLDLSRTRRLPSPLPDAATTTETGSDVTVTGTLFAARARSV